MDETLIRKIVEEVLTAMIPPGACSTPADRGGPQMLVIGDPSMVPEDMRCEYSLSGIEEYEKCRDIGMYDRIYITKLSLADLSGIAMGRDDTPVSCAVVNGLLRGKEVFLSDRALWYRKLAGRGSARLYSVIDGNVRQLESFGVKVISEEKPAPVREPVPPRFCPEPAAVPKGSLKPNASRVITEAAAREMAKENRSPVQIPREAIVTPSAWDVFTTNKIQVERI
ncbi:MAG: hypothetical protein HFG74_09040 [Hungatella sp.]|nr:hypothetical protein [Hungatella sp.]